MDRIRRMQLVMYDIRGIQKYIFRTSKIKDAIGASMLVDHIIEDALQYAVSMYNSVESESITSDFQWDGENGPLPFRIGKQDLQVLYIGGGNAFVLINGRDLAIRLNQYMSKFIISHTYSLQLAVAMIDKSQDYRENYRRLQEEMSRVKAGMVVSHPIGAMPFMKVEAKTGYPVSARVPSCLPGEREIGTETMLKREAGTRIERLTEHQRSILDNYVTEKGVDSILAVVHIDGNNMGMRIGELIRNDRTYESAISKMRQISHNIRYANQLTFHQMEEKYNAGHTENQYFVRPILVAGDDITYVCNGKIALDTVEYFCKRISEYDIYSDPSQAEDGQYWKENHKKNGMSVCAGIAFMSSHFPFYIAYDVAEECCKNAKDRAKKKENRDPAGDENGKIGNWVDFQICRNIHVTDFAGMRKHEYITRTGESLLRRPYFIPANDTDGTGKFALLDDSVSSFNRFKEDMAVFHPIPRTLLKELRNTYPRGRAAVTQIMQFWKSRGWELPAGPYLEPENSRPVARYYDALELMDLYMDPEGEDKA